MIFEDRIQANPRLFRLKDPRTNEIVDFEIQDLLPEEIIQEGTEIDAAYLNGLVTYSTEEKIVGYWIDRKPIYRKSYYISSLANTGATQIPLNITDLSDIIRINGLASNGSNFFPLPAYRGTQDAAGIQLYADINNGITIVTGNDRTNYHAFVTIEYTKTTA